MRSLRNLRHGACMALYCVARCGVMWRGLARRGVVWCDVARRGVARRPFLVDSNWFEILKTVGHVCTRWYVLGLTQEMLSLMSFKPVRRCLILFSLGFTYAYCEITSGSKTRESEEKKKIFVYVF